MAAVSLLDQGRRNRSARISDHRGRNLPGPFQKAADDLPPLLQELSLQEAASGYPPEIHTQIHRLADSKLEELRETILIHRREGSEAAKQILLTGRGKDLMGQLRKMVGDHLLDIETRLTGLNEAMDRDLRWDFYSMAGTSFAALVAGIIAWLLLRDTVRQALREERLSTEKHRAEQADREKSAFLATMSHEIRTPMNAILGFGELLIGEVKTDKEKRYAQSIVQSGQSLLQIINDILDLSKIEAGMMEVHTEATDVRDLAAFVQQLFAAQATAKGLELRVEVADDVPTSLMLDNLRLRQILINLTGNSIKFTTHGHITLRFGGSRRGDTRSLYHLLIQVEDTGPGIPANRLHEIFKPFVQVRQDTSKDLPGTGLGLAIVKRLTQLMDGTIFVDSKSGGGSTFQIDFQAVEISARLPQSVIASEPSVNFNDLRSSKILIVDDNATNRELVRGIFDNTHHHLREATNGRDAINAMLADRPDVVLMDIRMPVMDGRSAFDELRQTRELDLLPVIAVTASSMAGEEGNLRKTFDGYVRKPFSRAQLYHELAQFIPRVERAPQQESTTSQPVVQEDPAARRALASELQKIEKTEWPGVRDGMMLSEVSAFAARLKRLSEQTRNPELTQYVSILLNHCELFSLSGMEKSVQSFPTLIRQIESATPQSPAE